MWQNITGLSVFSQSAYISSKLAHAVLDCSKFQPCCEPVGVFEEASTRSSVPDQA